MTTPISRRSLVAGLALAPIAGLPPVAGAVVGDDPVFATLAELERASEHVEKVGEAHSRAEDAYHAARPARLRVLFDGEEIGHVGKLDAIYSLPRDVRTLESVESMTEYLRSQIPPPVSPEEQAARDAARKAEYEAARAETASPASPSLRARHWFRRSPKARLSLRRRSRTSRVGPAGALERRLAIAESIAYLERKLTVSTVITKRPERG